MRDSTVQPTPVATEQTADESASAHRSIGLQVQHLYLVLALSLVGFFISLRPVAPNDFWWHLRIGQMVVVDHHLPSTVMFAWTVPADKHYVHGEWLGAVQLFLGQDAGGLPLIIFARNALLLATVFLVGLETSRRTGSLKLAALAVGLTGLMTLNNVDLRPQIFAWLPFSLFVLLLARFTSQQLAPRWLALLPLVMVYWVNTHGSVVLGFAVLAAFLSGRLVDGWIRGREPQARRDFYLLGGVFIACILASLINPRGFHVFTYIGSVVSDAPSRTLGIEWQPPTPTGVVNGTFYVCVLLLLVALANSRYRPTTSELLLVSGLLWLAWSGQRYVIWYVIASMPILMQALAGVLPLRPSARVEGGPGVVNLALALLILLPLVAVQPWWVRSSPLPAEYLSSTLDPPAPAMLSRETPVGAVEYLRANPGGRLFNELGFGSYLIWALPEVPVFIDTRFEAYSLPLFEDYLEISQGRGAIQLLQKYGVDRVMLSREQQKKLSAGLANAPEWKREYQDSSSEVWRRSP